MQPRSDYDCGRIRTVTKGYPPNLWSKINKGSWKKKSVDTSSRLLGANFSQDLTWNAHLISVEKPLLPNLRKQVGAFKFLSKNIPVKSKKILAERFALSRLKCMLPLWGGTFANFHIKIQAVINNTAHVIIAKGRRASTQSLKTSSDWLNSYELSDYFSLSELWKTLRKKTPQQYMTEKITLDQDNRTEMVCHVSS